MSVAVYTLYKSFKGLPYAYDFAKVYSSKRYNYILVAHELPYKIVDYYGLEELVWMKPFEVCDQLANERIKAERLMADI